VSAARAHATSCSNSASAACPASRSSVSDDDAGLRQAIVAVLPAAAWQRCHVRSPRNALDCGPRKVDDDGLRELRRLDDRRDLAAWLAKWQATCPRLCGRVEQHIEQTLTFYRLPRRHHPHLKSTRLPERLNEEIRRRTHVVRIFPNAESCLRLVRALAVEMPENGLEARRSLNRDDLREHNNEARRMAA
jgi:putative transposase